MVACGLQGALTAEAALLFRTFDCLRRREFVRLVLHFVEHEFKLAEVDAVSALLGAIPATCDGRDAGNWQLSEVVPLFQRACWPGEGGVAAAALKYAERVRAGAAFTAALVATRVPAAELTDDQLDTALEACLALCWHIRGCWEGRPKPPPYRCPSFALEAKWDAVHVRLTKGSGVRGALAGAVAVGVASQAAESAGGGVGGGEPERAAWGRLVPSGRKVVSLAEAQARTVDASVSQRELPLSALLNPACRKVRTLLKRYGEPTSMTVNTGSVSFQFCRLREQPVISSAEPEAEEPAAAAAGSAQPAPPRPLSFIDFKFAAVREGRPWRRISHYNSPELCRDQARFRSGLAGSYHGNAVEGWAAEGTPVVCLDPGRILLFASEEVHVSARVGSRLPALVPWCGGSGRLLPLLPCVSARLCRARPRGRGCPLPLPPPPPPAQGYYDAIFVGGTRAKTHVKCVAAAQKHLAAVRDGGSARPAAWALAGRGSCLHDVQLPRRAGGAFHNVCAQVGPPPLHVRVLPHVPRSGLD